MKKTRFLALLLCLAFALGCLPPLPARAANQLTLVNEGFRHSQYFRVKNSTVGVTLTLDFDTMKAVANYSRLGDLELDPQELMRRKPEEYAWIAMLESNTSGTVTYDIHPGGESKWDGCEWYLTNASGAESFIWGIDEVVIDPDRAAYAHPETVTCRYTTYVNTPEGYRDENVKLNFFYAEDLSIKKGGDGFDYQVYVNGISFCMGFGLNVSEGAPALPPPQEKEYTMQRDNFSFRNSYSSFTSGGKTLKPEILGGEIFDSGTYGSMLEETAYNAMTRGLKPSQLAELHAFLSGPWRGACRGMAIVSGLLYENHIFLSDVGGAKDAYSLAAPVENTMLLRAITFYQVWGNYETGRRAAANSEELALKIVKSLQDDPQSPVAVGFSYGEFDNNEKIVKHNHAVLAFKVENNPANGCDYAVSVYDPNQPKEAQYIYVNKLGDFYFPPHANVCFTSVARVQELENATLSYPALTQGTAVVRGDGDMQFTSGGRTSTVTGEKLAGDLPVEAEKDSDGSVTTAYIPVANGESVSVRLLGGTNASVQTGDTFALITGGATELTVNPDGSVTAKTNGTVSSLAVASDKTGGSLFGTTVETKAGEITITPTSDGAKVTASGTADITVSGGDNSVKFEDVDTSKGVDIKNSGNNSTLSSDGQEIAKGTASASGGTAQNTPAQPTQPAADKRQISDGAAQKAGGNSAQIVDKRKNSGDTTEQFRSRRRNKQYSPWAELELALADALGIIPEALMDKLQGSITRREFAQLVYNTVKAATGMSDADMAKYAAKPGNAYDAQYSDPAVAFAYGVGIVGGYPDGSFGPDNTITREQAAKMLVVMAELLGKQTTEAGAKKFNDAPNNWAQTYINKISSVTSPYSGARVMGGDDKGNFNPNGTFTTEQAVATMLRMFEGVVGEKSNYTGGVIQTAQPGSTVTLCDDNDMTGYTPKEWSWVAEGEGYGRKYFTSGKYVRDDGRAVIYIDSGDSCDGFSYQLFVMAGGAKQSNYEAYDFEYGTSYCWASNRDETHAGDSANGISFKSLGNGCMIVETDWIDEMYAAYDDPAGVYYLVREKR